MKRTFGLLLTTSKARSKLQGGQGSEAQLGWPGSVVGGSWVDL